MKSACNSPAAYLAEALKYFNASTDSKPCVWRGRASKNWGAFGRKVCVELSRELVLSVRDFETLQVLAESAPGQLATPSEGNTGVCSSCHHPEVYTLNASMRKICNSPATYLVEGLKFYQSATLPPPHPIWIKLACLGSADFDRVVNVQLSRDLVLRVRAFSSGQVLAESVPGNLARIAPHLSAPRESQHHDARAVSD